MIIDRILDRKDGDEYNAREFYNYCREEERIFGLPSISMAMDYGDENDVRRELCDYIYLAGYNPAICDYVNSVNWLE